VSRTGEAHADQCLVRILCRLLQQQRGRDRARELGRDARRTRFGEIDLVARDGETLVFVEVRLRSSDRFGGGAESIGAHKRRRIVAAARHYLARVRPEPPCRFDVVTLDGGAPEWLRAAFDAVVE